MLFPLPGYGSFPNIHMPPSEGFVEVAFSREPAFAPHPLLRPDPPPHFPIQFNSSGYLLFSI